MTGQWTNSVIHHQEVVRIECNWPATHILVLKCYDVKCTIHPLTFVAYSDN
jgi:hypothetical protein